MTYEESVRYLVTLGRELASPQQASVAKFDLENITTLCERLGQPQQAFLQLGEVRQHIADMPAHFHREILGGSTAHVIAVRPL